MINLWRITNCYSLSHTSFVPFAESSGLQGNIPSEIGLLSRLETMFLDDNELFGGIPAEIYQLFTLKLLSLGDCFLVGSLSSEIGNLVNLEVSSWKFHFFHLIIFAFA
jgi:hypothetical protein